MGRFIILILFFLSACSDATSDKEREKKISESEEFLASQAIQDNGKKIEISCDEDGKRVLNDTSIITDAFSKQIKAKLILRFTELNCEACVDATITSLRKIFKADSAKKKVIILTSYKEKIYFDNWKKVNQIDFTTHNIGDCKLSFLSEKFDKPYFFYVDSSGISCDVFFPIKERLADTETYLKQIAKKM